jgi:hypothetical protein
MKDRNDGEEGKRSAAWKQARESLATQLAPIYATLLDGFTDVMLGTVRQHLDTARQQLETTRRQLFGDPVAIDAPEPEVVRRRGRPPGVKNGTRTTRTKKALFGSRAKPIGKPPLNGKAIRTSNPPKSTDKAPNGVKARRRHTKSPRDGDEIRALSTQIRGYVAKHPNCFMVDIAKEIGINAKQLALPMKKLTAHGTILRKGARRSCKYWLSPASVRADEQAQA